MTQGRRRSPRYRLATLFILLACSNAFAVEIIDARDLHQQKSSDQPVTGFYAVAPDGQTRPIGPVNSGLAPSGRAGRSSRVGARPSLVCYVCALVLFGVGVCFA